MTCSCNKKNKSMVGSSTTPSQVRGQYSLGCIECNQANESSVLTDIRNANLYGDQFLMALAWNDEYDELTGTMRKHGIPSALIDWCPDNTAEISIPCYPHITYAYENGYLVVRDTRRDGSPDQTVDYGGQIVIKRSTRIPAKAISGKLDANQIAGLCDAIMCCFDGESIRLKDQTDCDTGKPKLAAFLQLEGGKCIEFDEETQTIDLCLEGEQTNSIEVEITDDCKIKANLILDESDSCVNLSVSENGLLASLKISEEGCNAIECRADGAYVHKDPSFNIISASIPRDATEPETITVSVKGEVSADSNCISGEFPFVGMTDPDCEAPDGHCWVAVITAQANSRNPLGFSSDNLIDVKMTVCFNGSANAYGSTPTNLRFVEDSGSISGANPNNTDLPIFNASGIFPAKDSGNTASLKFRACFANQSAPVNRDFCFNNLYLTGFYKLVKCNNNA